MLGQAGTGTRMREMRGIRMDAYSNSVGRAGFGNARHTGRVDC